MNISQTIYLFFLGCFSAFTTAVEPKRDLKCYTYKAPVCTYVPTDNATVNADLSKYCLLFEDDQNHYFEEKECANKACGKFTLVMANAVKEVTFTYGFCTNLSRGEEFCYVDEKGDLEMPAKIAEDIALYKSVYYNESATSAPLDLNYTFKSLQHCYCHGHNICNKASDLKSYLFHVVALSFVNLFIVIFLVA